MHITFSLFYDGFPFSDKAASLGELRTGPAINKHAGFFMLAQGGDSQ